MNRNEAIGAAVNFAASALPEGWKIEVGIEHGAGWAELYNPDGERIGKEQQEAGDLDLQDSIIELVRIARLAVPATPDTGKEK